MISCKRGLLIVHKGLGIFDYVAGSSSNRVRCLIQRFFKGSMQNVPHNLPGDKWSFHLVQTQSVTVSICRTHIQDSQQKEMRMNVSWELVSPGRLRALTNIVPSEVWGQKNRKNPQCCMGLCFLACSVRRPRYQVRLRGC